MNKLAFLVGGVAWIGCLAAAATTSCGGSGQVTPGEGGHTGTTTQVCDPGTFRHCDCELGGTGTQTCSADGKSWGLCVDCETEFDAGPVQDAAPACGDTACNGDETCATCPADCGECPTCMVSPTCTGASSVPANPTPLDSFNNNGQTMFSCGSDLGGSPDEEDCSEPLLKMRLYQVVVHDAGASGSKLEMFCLIQADDGQSSQLVMTPDWANLSDGSPPLVISPAAGTFWGQAVNGIKLSQFNITITYQCYMVLTPGVLEQALGAVSDFAGSTAAIPGNPYGWAFGVGGAAAAAAAALAATGDGVVPLLNVEQTIDAKALLTLTNGYTWKIQQSGETKANGTCGFFGPCDWDWELDVEAWGCAAPKGQMPQ